MQIISNIALITINETLFIQLISFLIFVFAFNRIMIQPLRSVMAERDHSLKDLNIRIQEAEKELVDLSEQVIRYEKKMKKEAGHMLKEMEDAAKIDAEKVHTAAYKEIESLRFDAEIVIKNQLNEARKSLEAEAEKLSVVIMETILDRRLN